MVLSICSERGSTGHRGWSRIREEVERREYTAARRVRGDHFLPIALRRQAKPLADRGIAEFPQVEDICRAVLEGNTRHIVRGLIEPFNDRSELGGLFAIGQELGLDDEFH